MRWKWSLHGPSRDRVHARGRVVVVAADIIRHPQDMICFFLCPQGLELKRGRSRVFSQALRISDELIVVAVVIVVVVVRTYVRS